MVSYSVSMSLQFGTSSEEIKHSKTMKKKSILEKSKEN